MTGFDPNRSPGGAIRPENKLIRKALLRILETEPGEQYVVKTRADAIALELVNIALAGGKDRVPAIRELCDRADGKAAISVEEADALAAGGAKVVLIDSRMLPPTTHIDAEMLEDSSEDDPS